MSGGRGVRGNREVSPLFLLRGGGGGRIAATAEATSKEGGSWGKHGFPHGSESKGATLTPRGGVPTRRAASGTSRTRADAASALPPPPRARRRSSVPVRRVVGPATARAATRRARRSDGRRRRRDGRRAEATPFRSSDSLVGGKRRRSGPRAGSCRAWFPARTRSRRRHRGRPAVHGNGDACRRRPL